MQNKDEIFNNLREILSKNFDIEKTEISLEANIYDDLDLDSIDAVDLVIELKELTGKKIAPTIFKSVKTVEDIVDAVFDLMND